MNILITGCSRGIGRGFLERYLKQAAVKKIYAVTTHAETLKDLEKHSEGKCQVLAISVSEASAPAQLQEALNGVPLDLLINCAGVYTKNADELEALTAAQIEDGMKGNVYSALYTLQGTLPALKRAKHAKVASLTSLMGSISDNTSGGAYAYRMSKAALNMMNKCFSVDHPELTAVVLHPGWVQTDMGGKSAPTTIAESVEGMMKKIETLQKTDTGKFFDHEGDELGW